MHKPPPTNPAVRRLAVAVLLSSLLPFGCATSAPEPRDAASAADLPSAAPAPAAPATCPYGHTTLRDVPVLYGLPIMTPDLRRRVDAGEVILGGCVGDSPDRFLVCRRCGYRHNPAADEWVRTGEDAAGFERRLDPLVAGFPFPPPPKAGERVFYRQVVRGGRVTDESAGRSTDQPAAAVEATVRGFFGDRGLPEPRLERRDFRDREMSVYRCDHNGRTIEVTTMRRKDGGGIHVAVDLTTVWTRH
jgi:hypothetical protein